MQLNKYFSEQFKDKETKVMNDNELCLCNIFIKETLPLLQDKSFQNLCFLMNSAILFIKINRCTNGKDTLTNTDMISKLISSQEKIHKLLGIDAKALGSKRKNSLGEDILSIIENSPFFKDKNQVGSLGTILPMIHLKNSKETPKDGDFDKWDKLPDAKLTEYLAEA